MSVRAGTEGLLGGWPETDENDTPLAAVMEDERSGGGDDHQIVAGELSVEGLVSAQGIKFKKKTWSHI